MKLKRITINGKDVFVTDDNYDVEEIVKLMEEEKDDNETIETTESEDSVDYFKKLSENIKSQSGKYIVKNLSQNDYKEIKSSLDEIQAEAKKHALEDNMKEYFDDDNNHIRIFAHSSNTSYVGKGKKSKHIAKAAPFMNKDDLNEMLQSYINDDDNILDEENALEVIPFLRQQNVDDLFIKCINNSDSKIKSSYVAPFVSKNCFSTVVEKYINGEYPDLNVESLYPFLDFSDVKKVFNYIMKKEDK